MDNWTISTWIKFGVSATGFFLGGFATAYQANPNGTWIAWVVGGTAALASYITGFFQMNPSLHKS